MKYLVPRSGSKKRAHLWDESLYDIQGDTFCKMYSTGGLSKKKYVVAERPFDHEICQMCENVARKFSVAIPEGMLEYDLSVESA